MAESGGELSAADGINAIAYRQQSGTTPNAATVVFIHGFRSDMLGTKAEHLATACSEKEIPFLRFDLRGHGRSGGSYTDFSISDWLEDCLTVIDRLTSGPLVMVGSSLGGWLMLRTALQRPDRVKAMVGIAAAPDFVSEFILPQMTEAHRSELARQGYFTTPSGFPEPNRFTQKLLDDGTSQRVLHQPVSFEGPVRLLQGMRDEDVPWQHALKIQSAITGSDVEIKLYKDGDHRLSNPAQLEELGRIVCTLSGN